jgi:hypothetical protein
MKIEIGEYKEQISFGISFNSFNNHKALIFDFGVYYLEIRI